MKKTFYLSKVSGDKLGKQMYETANQKKPTSADTITISLNCKALVKILLNPS